MDHIFSHRTDGGGSLEDVVSDVPYSTFTLDFDDLFTFKVHSLKIAWELCPFRWSAEIALSGNIFPGHANGPSGLFAVWIRGDNVMGRHIHLGNNRMVSWPFAVAGKIHRFPYRGVYILHLTADCR